jgi:hypothetical protein
MNSFIEGYRLIEKNAPLMGGVFTLSDLRILFNKDNPVLLHRRIKAFQENGVFARFHRGYYVTASCDLESLSARIYPNSYISAGNVLSREMIIGAVPSKTVYAVKPGRSRTFEGSCGKLVYLGVLPHLMFGFRREGPRGYAVPEKAFLDVLYFLQKGRTFSFDPFSDVDQTRVDKALILDFLSKYRNPKFVAFVKGVIGDHDR